MTLKHALMTGLAVAGLMMSTGTSWAQNGNTNAGNAPAAGQSGQQKDPWYKVCDPTKKGEKVCLTKQVQVGKVGFLGSFTLRNDPSASTPLGAIAAVPTGVLLPYQMLVQIDNAKPTRQLYIQCDAVSCMSMFPVNEAFVNSLKKGKELKLIAKVRSGDLTVHMSLNGFTKAYDDPNAPTTAELQKRLNQNIYRNSGLPSDLATKTNDLAAKLRAKQQDQSQSSGN